MTLIEGVGDEVTNFFIVVLVLLVGWLAWCSTSIVDQPLIRTVFIFTPRTLTRITELRSNQNASIANRPSNLEISEEESVEPIAEDNSDTLQSCPESSIADTNREISPETHTVSEATATEEVLIKTMDSFNNDSTPLLQRQTKIEDTKETNIPASTCTDSVEQQPENLSINDANKISIKLKFINDDQKVVTGSLKELLGDFKRRHFQIEFEAQKLVRLVFKGRVLQPDSHTLERCGLYNNCVVHCLIHQPRPNPVPSQTSTLDNSSTFYLIPQSFSNIPATLADIPVAREISSVHNEWDLSRLLVSILTLLIGLAWYTLYHCAQLFTATTTLALYALTAIFTVSLFSHFFLDQDNIRNIE
ncbi:transmembrane and ubiquitin-like domain-containing protein 1 [Hylaeus anthracinus]|uniref:transmembrane and ubiquitin-like domain-containing protein 1 n=1 Tax=Hylaeus anthracinus TaxID=313031 RepID=UPI0023B9C3AD|nr:transmembrane and ubiquitin-like domain-containing protein 1 [Hylaeus anthracinus]XP_054003591.1 transmembrane and ubiquitin-like domain-containing protein 1 [Hylaeus anthracinus]XP_054003592.1 transmembrane and ubiquitin-like domain-containing protein 1 [Hylaeus anthracinus]XP_054003593.1 transmembrane and ubiquitin-like domain-containing protein 1 [Hylaeus anthracinus]